METSIFIARIIGPLLLVSGLAAITNRTLLEDVGREFLHNRALLFLAGILALIAGLAIVNTHNLWVADWPVIITALGWMAVAGGVVRMAFPSVTRRMGAAMLSNRPLIVAIAAIQILIGGWLFWVGYL